MELEFTLNVTVKGHSLDEIDEGLLKAAGQRLVARMAGKPGMGIAPSVMVKRENLPPEAQEALAEAEEKKAAEAAAHAAEAAAVAAGAGVSAPSTPAPEPHHEEEPAKRGRGRKSNAEKAAEAAKAAAAATAAVGAPHPQAQPPAAPPAAPAPATAPPALVHTIKDVEEAVGKVCNKHGVPKAFELLKRFEVTKVRFLPEGKYAEFIKACAEEEAKPAA